MTTIHIIESVIAVVIFIWIFSEIINTPIQEEEDEENI